MKKILITAAAASFLVFGGQTEIQAADVEVLDTQPAQVQEMGKWSRFRDKYILGRETARERREREEWERHRDYYGPPPSPPSSRHRDYYGPPPSPPSSRHRDYYGPPPSPPSSRHRDYYGPPPSPPSDR